MERLDQCHLHPKLEVAVQTFPNWESNPGLCYASTLEKSFTNCLIITIWNIYIWALDQWRMLETWLPPVHVIWTYMNIHEHTWTALGCRRNSTCKAPAKHLAAAKTSALATCNLQHIHCQTGQIMLGVNTMKRLDQGHIHPKLEGPGLTCPSLESNPGLHDARRAL